MSAAPGPALSISQAAERTGLSPDTLRYYERIGLIDPVPRSASGYRVYDEGALQWLEFVLHLRDTGMPVRDMLEFARLRRQGEHTAPQRRALLAGHREKLREQARRLESTLGFLDRKIDHYDGIAARAVHSHA
ncbi:MerR family transcriptional regulator [Nocardiopsis sediminis]|uniref:MerR family transcriptional regulator n=1 Tax=Nocardiopsis sediminis TaxID=1778267 RepID=A0ABV8FMQ0_9ACTN